MAWRLVGAKPLSDPMMFSLLTHIIYDSRLQWIKLSDKCPTQIGNTQKAIEDWEKGHGEHRQSFHCSEGVYNTLPHLAFSRTWYCGTARGYISVSASANWSTLKPYSLLRFAQERPIRPYYTTIVNGMIPVNMPIKDIRASVAVIVTYVSHDTSGPMFEMLQIILKEDPNILIIQPLSLSWFLLTCL